jgi:hypothetical protein
MPVKPDQIAWLSKALGVPAETLKAIVRRAMSGSVEVPVTQTGQALSALGAPPPSTTDANIADSETGGFTAGEPVAIPISKSGTPGLVEVPAAQVGQALSNAGAPPPSTTDADIADGETGGFSADGPPVAIPFRTSDDGSVAPAKILEINAGSVDTDLGLPPDDSLVQVTRTDLQPRPGVRGLNANEPIPADLRGNFDAVISNNPRGYTPDVENIGDALHPGGRMIFQGKTEVQPGERGINPDFRRLMDEVAPEGAPPNPPPGYSVVPEMPASAASDGPEVPLRIPTVRGSSAEVPKPADIMGGPFNRTDGDPAGWPNARLIVAKDTKGTAPAADPALAKGSSSTTPADADPGLDAETGAGDPQIDDITATPGADPGALPARFQGPSKPVKLFDNEPQPIEPGSPNLSANPTPGDPIPYELGDGPPPGQVQVRPADGSPVADPLAQTQEMPAVEPPPSSSSGGDSTGAGGAEDATAAESAEAGLGGAAEAGVVGGLMAGGMTAIDDIGKVRSGQMSVTDAVEDVGEKTGEVGVLATGGKVIADAMGSGVGDAAAAGFGDAAAGAAGDAAGAGLGAAGAGGVIGGVVAGGMALIDDVGKVEDGTMTGGHAAVDVTAKTAVGVGAGLAGAAAGAEIGAAVGSIIPGAGTVVGLAAGAVIGGAVGYVGNKLMNTETGKAILDAAGSAVDATIDGVKEAGEAIGDAASAAGGAISDAASTAVDAASSAASAVESAVGDAAGAVEDAAGAAVDKAEDLAGDAVSAVGDALSSIF